MQDEGLTPRILLDDAGLQEDIDKWLAASIAAGHFACRCPDLTIIDLQAGQGRDHVLHHLHGNPVAGQVRAAWDFHAVEDIHWNAVEVGQVLANEDNSRVTGCWPKLKRHVPAAPVAKAGYFRRCFQRLLTAGKVAWLIGMWRIR